MNPIRKLIAALLFGLCGLLAASTALATVPMYFWNFTLMSSAGATPNIHPGDAVDLSVTLINQSLGELSIFGDGCLDFPALCSGNEGITVNLDPLFGSFDISSATAPPVTVAAGGQQTFLIGTLNILPGAPTNQTFHVQVDVILDPQIDANTKTVIAMPDPAMMSRSLPVYVTAVPEPASWLFMAVGVAAVWRRRTSLAG